ncbi:MAG: DUF4388 domain-containing protein [Myxococcota bacterium]
MSLVGSLEDLGLGDILQIVHLAAKSGVLRLRNEAGEGQIVFQRGMIREAYVKGGPTDLRELLASRRAVPGKVLERAWLEAHHGGRSLAELLVERELVSADAIDVLRREQIESAVLTMFGWPSGEFSFEMRDVADEGAELVLEDGMNPQFLALEGTRRADEVALERQVAPEEPAGTALADPGGALLEVELLSGEDEAEFETVPEALVETEPAALVETEPAALAVVEPEAHAEVEPEVAPARDAAPSAPRKLPPVVVIDPSLPALEWVKAALAPSLPRVHVFQRPDLGIERIRQYLARAERPLVLVATDVPADAASGARDALDLVARLKRQAPNMTVLLLHDEGQPPRLRRGPAGPDGCAPRPAAALLVDPRAARPRMDVATALQEALDRHLEAAPPSAARTADGDDELAQLREMSARIRDGAGRGEILTQVLSFAAARFARVALFGVQEDRVVGVAQTGLARAGGPEDADLRELSLGATEPAWFRRVIEQRTPRRAAPEDEGDQRLAVLLGNEIPLEAYVAPIVTAERVVALLYADNLPGGEPLGDTGSLEVLLDAAGIALDRAVLERTSAEGDG